MSKPNPKSKGLKLLKKGQNGIFHAVFSRFGLIVVMLLIQAAVLLWSFIWLQSYLPHLLGGTAVLRLVIMFYLLNKEMSGTARTSWLIITMTMPVFGILLYFFTKADTGHRLLKKTTGKIIEETKQVIPQEKEVLEQLERENKGAGSLSRYMQRSGCHPVYKNTEAK
ncbi:MAG: PLD nuclease N-terminal domain-containing protein, partial [Ruminiclostridium sp.]|nr:PLD nuclease N-terminal domain-containing protein [Ruminiclostridium sp.]